MSTSRARQHYHPVQRLHQPQKATSHLASAKEAESTLSVVGGSLWMWGLGQNALLDISGANLSRPCLLSAIDSLVVDVACSSTHAIFVVGEPFSFFLLLP